MFDTPGKPTISALVKGLPGNDLEATGQAGIKIATCLNDCVPGDGFRPVLWPHGASKKSRITPTTIRLNARFVSRSIKPEVRGASAPIFLWQVRRLFGCSATLKRRRCGNFLSFAVHKLYPVPVQFA
jgi:hypothetical protein